MLTRGPGDALLTWFLGPSMEDLSQLLAVDRGKHEEPVEKGAGRLSIQLMMCVLHLSSLKVGVRASGNLSILSPVAASREAWTFHTWQL